MTCCGCRLVWMCYSKRECSQVFYYLRSLDDALTHALGAGALFDISDQSEYVKTIVGKRICLYTFTARWLATLSSDML